MSLPKSWTTVTPLSKTIAMVIFIFLPLLAFFAGVRYQQRLDQVEIKNLQHDLQFAKDRTDYEVYKRWSEYKGYGFSMLYSGDYHPVVKKGNNSTIVQFIHERGSVGVNISIDKSSDSLQAIRSKLITLNDYYPPGNFQFITFNGYPALKYKQAWNTNMIVLANGYEYFIENPFDENDVVERMPSTLRFAKGYFK